MGHHEKMALSAWSRGLTSVEFKHAAQRNANGAWFFFLLTVAVWYFTTWKWALIPGALAAFQAIQSVSSTMIQTRVEKLEAPTEVEPYL